MELQLTQSRRGLKIKKIKKKKRENYLKALEDNCSMQTSGKCEQWSITNYFVKEKKIFIIIITFLSFFGCFRDCLQISILISREFKRINKESH